MVYNKVDRFIASHKMRSSQGVKALDFDSNIRKFESCLRRSRAMWVSSFLKDLAARKDEKCRQGEI